MVSQLAMLHSSVPTSAHYYYNTFIYTHIKVPVSLNKRDLQMLVHKCLIEENWVCKDAMHITVTLL